MVVVGVAVVRVAVVTFRISDIVCSKNVVDQRRVWTSRTPGRLPGGSREVYPADPRPDPLIEPCPLTNGTWC